MFNKMIVAFLLIFSMSCAKKYYPLEPQSLGFRVGDTSSDIEVGYEYNLLGQKGNRKYFKKEQRKNIRLVAVKITNHFDHSINIRRDVQFLVNGYTITLLDPQIAYNKLKQRPILYILYAFVFFRVPTYNNNGTQGSFIVPLGLPFAAYNMAVGFGANKKFLMDMEMFNLNNKIISPGESFVGLLSFYYAGYPNLTDRLK